MGKHRTCLLLMALLIVSGCNSGEDPIHPPRPQPPESRFEERIDALMAELTVPEKASLMVNDARAVPRLGIPAYGWWNEALHGVARAGIATVFPQAIGLAATWDDRLLYEVAVIISDEARAKHHEAVRHEIRTSYHGLTFWSPNINIFRDPRWGRGQETYGEDPYLTSRLAVSFVKGLQGSDPRYRKVDATLKHFAVHSGPEPLRHAFDADCSERDLRETYLYAFERAVREARPAAVMCAYNRFRGDPCCASPLLLGILRQEWGFDGYVVSDCGAIWDIFASHHYAPDAIQASGLAVSRGCDLNCGPTYITLPLALPEGLVTAAAMDRSLRRLLRTRFTLGMFDPEEEVPYAGIPFAVNDSPPHRRKNLETARKSIVLLQNDGLLPLRKEALTRIAVLGPSADDVDVLVGNYHGTPSRPVTLLEGIRNEAGPGVEVVYEPGCGYVGGPEFFLPALARLRGADVAIVCAGLTPRLEGEEGALLVPLDGFDRGDRTRIELPRIQRAFIRAVHDTGVPVVLVLTTGSALAIPEESGYLRAIVNCWYPGGEGGTAVADVLFGNHNPAGRLPVTFYRATEDLPPFEDYDMAGRTYRYFRGEILYPFGHGLSYTDFAYSGLRLSKQRLTRSDRTLRVGLDVENTGPMDGEEVVQLYVRDPEPDRPLPVKRLVAFERVAVPVGGRVGVELEVSVRDLAHYEDGKGFVVGAGDFEIQAGASSEDIRLRAVLTYR